MTERFSSRLLPTCLALLVAMAACASAAPLKRRGEAGRYSGYMDLATRAVNLTRIREHAEALLSLGNRELAASYVSQCLARLGLRVWRQSYTVPVPQDENSTLEILSPVRRAVRVYALPPNAAETCSCDVQGELVYVGRGELSDLRSASVAGKVVLMDLDSGYNWLLAASLGARAVLFVERPGARAEEYASKYLADAPLRFPRALVKLEEARRLISLLKRGRVLVRLRLRVRWVMANLTNVLAVIPGERGGEALLIAASYDSRVPLPALAVDERSAASTAALLELAKLLARGRPLRTVFIAALSGSALGMAGARALAESLIRAYGPLGSARDQLKVALILDLPPAPAGALLLAQGGFYGDFGWERAPVRSGLESLLTYLTSVGEYRQADGLYVVCGR
ncbi:MAG: hypothetical protein DRJ56_08120, partial [Thermoprotei archaeon]